MSSFSMFDMCSVYGCTCDCFRYLSGSEMRLASWSWQSGAEPTDGGGFLVSFWLPFFLSFECFFLMTSDRAFPSESTFFGSMLVLLSPLLFDSSEVCLLDFSDIVSMLWESIDLALTTYSFAQSKVSSNISSWDRALEFCRLTPGGSSHLENFKVSFLA